MERRIRIHDKEVLASFALDKIDEYKFLLAGIPDDFKFNDIFALKAFRKIGFQNRENTISIPSDIGLIEKILNLLREHCRTELELYKEALCKL